MKKNKMMRVASILLVAVLLTTSIISGTFAKYVTGDEREDEARVAMFGVKAVANGMLFGENYVSVDEGNTPDVNNEHGEAEAEEGYYAKLTVVSSNGDNLVAPGTKNTDDGYEGFIFGVTGKPEVDVYVDLDFSAGSDIWLAAGTYADLTTGDAFEEDIANFAGEENVTFELEDDYYPMQYTLEKSTDNGETWEAIADATNVKLADIIDYLDENIAESGYYDANTDLGEEIGLYKLTWEWAFDGEQTLNEATFDADTVDKADTLLGDLASDKYGDTSVYEDAKWAIFTASEGDVTGLDLAGEMNTLTADAGSHSLEVDFSFSATVTQVD